MLCIRRFRSVSFLSQSCASGQLARWKSESHEVFRILECNVNVESQRHKDAYARNAVAETLIEKFTNQAMAGGGQRGVHRHVVVNKKMLPHDRVRSVLDKDAEDTFFLGLLAGLGMDYGDVPNAGGIAGKHLIQIDTMPSESTFKGGTVFPIGLKKHVMHQEMALRNRLPYINLTDSGGAFLPMQAEIFPDKLHGGRTFRNQAVLQSQGLPQVTVVCGSCTAGGAYVPVMAQQSIMIKDLGYIYLAGPPLVKAATGEDVSDAELGGAEVHSRISGGSDYMAEDEADAYEICREVTGTMNLPKLEFPNDFSSPIYPESELRYFSGLLDVNANDIYNIIARIVDSSRFHEFKKPYGSALITGFGHIGGILVGILANCGSISNRDAQKGAHFIWMCEFRDIPLIFLQYSSLSNENERVKTSLDNGIELKDKAKMMQAVACAKVPRITVNVGGCFSAENYTMSGPSFKPNVMLSWPTALSYSEMPNKEQILKDSDLSKVDSAWDFAPSTAFSCAFNMETDALVLPQDTRKALLTWIRIAKHSQINQYHGQPTANPVFRM